MSTLADHEAPTPAATRPAVPVRLRDGTAARLRPLGAGEAAPLRAVFDGLSPGSRAARYLTGMARLAPSMEAALVDVDGDQHVGWVALVGDRPVGIARYVRIDGDPATAELAFEVVDGCHGRGVGTALLDALSTHAAYAGVRRLRASLHRGNTTSRRLLKRLGAIFTTEDDLLLATGELRLLDPPAVDRTAVRALVSPADAGTPPPVRPAGSPSGR
jgi:RimJ/RimL family protein N-acetyltransferase